MKRSLPIFLVIVNTLTFGFGQNDSLQNTAQDSLLESRQEQNEELLSRADSIRMADSLERAILQEQITNLQASEEQRKAELQARLDSLRQMQDQREARIRQQVDSLRAVTPGVPVILFSDTIFYIYAGLGPFSASDRAENITRKIEQLVDEYQFDPGQIRVVENEGNFDLVHDQTILLSITSRDGIWLDESPEQVAEQYGEAIKKTVADHQIRTGLLANIFRIGLLLLVLAVFYFGIKFMNRAFSWLNNWMVRRGNRFIKGVKFRNYEFLSEEREKYLVIWVLNALKWAIIVLIVYLALPVVFSIFPATKGIADTLFGYILNPLNKFISAVVDYIPKLFSIIVILTVAYYTTRFLQFLSSEIEKGRLNIPGFYSDWAKPTSHLLQVVIFAFAFVVIFPYLPGSDSRVFQGVSVFFGLLISLGSSSAISNIIAGLVITYMRAFKMGDRVKIGETTGDVIDKTLLVTRVRTIKNEDVTIPNSAILTGSTINYSSSAKKLGLILNTTVTIGYDVPWRQVHELLISAALKTEHVKQEPKPFVLQTSLDDYYVSYQINAYTEQAGRSAGIYSELYSHIQDAFNGAGVEILSPHYRANRDGNAVTIPANSRPVKDQPPTASEPEETKSDGDDRPDQQ